MAQINIRIDDSLKEKADELFDELGMNMTTAFTVFVKTAVRQRRIPFDLSLGPKSEISQEEYLALLDELCGSIDDPTFVEPIEIPWEHNTPRIEVK